MISVWLIDLYLSCWALWYITKGPISQLQFLLVTYILCRCHRQRRENRRICHPYCVQDKWLLEWVKQQWRWKSNFKCTTLPQALWRPNILIWNKRHFDWLWYVVWFFICTLVFYERCIILPKSVRHSLKTISFLTTFTEFCWR